MPINKDTEINKIEQELWNLVKPTLHIGTHRKVVIMSTPGIGTSRLHELYENSIKEKSESKNNIDES